MSTAAECFFAGCRAAFAQARATQGGETHPLTLAGAPLSLDFAGTVLPALLLPAFALPAATDEQEGPALAIELWDFAETGVAAPPSPWPREVYGVLGARRGRVPGFCNARFETVLSDDKRLLWMLDRTAGRAIVWMRGLAELPSWEHLHPLRGLLHAWLTHRGLHLLHAGAVGDARGGLLVAGRGGAGKSTTVLAALAGGLTSAGDDYVILSEQPRPVVHALYGTMRLFADHATRFPGLLPAADHSDIVAGRPKLAAYISRHRAAALVPALPLRGLVAPQVQPDATSALQPISAEAALAALAPSTLQQLRSSDAALAAMAALCNRLPCWRLVLGRSMAELPALLRGLLATASADRAAHA